MSVSNPQTSGDELDAELEWELDEGIPQFEDPFIQKYLGGREALIAQEKKQRHDQAFKGAMSPMAWEAARIMSLVRKRELETVWTGEFEEELAHKNNGNLFPGMMFMLARDRMEKTDLWKIISKMPKGSILHAHMDAMIDTDWLLEQAFEIPGYHITSNEPLVSQKALDYGPFEFRYIPEGTTQTTDSIWTTSYKPNTPVPISAAASSFPGGLEAFKSWVISRMVITADESLFHHHGLDEVWRKFQSCFIVIDGLFYTEPIFRRCIPRLLDQLHSDGIKYVELRLAFGRPWFRANSSTPEPNYLYFFQCFEEELSAYKSSPSGAGFWDARILWTAIRKFDNHGILANMKNCIECKLAYPHLISGFDFVAQEDKGRPLVDLISLCFWFRKACAENGLEIPFFFHAGECLGDGNSTDNNLFDAILLGTRRIGHGFSLYKHPLLIDMAKDKRILIECCPISHEILRLTNSILSHPMPALHSRGVPVSLSNDDPAILGHGKNGLTHDFYQTYLAFDNLGLEGLGTMAENSVKWSAFEDETQADWTKGIKMGKAGTGVKGERVREWNQDFEKWCEWVVKEFALTVDDEEEDVED
ncbi:putative cecr1 family adenosine [Phaeomoniella chlamydospora]|uniref:adenosine deaminase n=1 Tax=Phaeomoniella chlamydospora TaxID=158046 RepID=A0A0G2EZF9_PHACM|nr:putative cecr1 family adenosine [Phaeomoniella chlamydospora]